MSQLAHASVQDFLRRHMPFQRMATEHVAFLAKRLRLAFYGRGEVLLQPENSPVERFYIIKQGRINAQVRKPDGKRETTFELHTGDGFPMAALLSGGEIQMVYQAEEDSFCFETDRETFETLLTDSAEFRDFCRARLANLLSISLDHMQAQSVNQIAHGSSLNQDLGSLIRREPIIVNPETPIQSVLETLSQQRIGCVPVVDTELRPVGIFTLHDVLPRVVLPKHDLNQPISNVMTANPYALRRFDTAQDAALLMASRGFGHVCVIEGERLIGVISERDLFALQRVGLVQLGRTILNAESLDELPQHAADIQRLAQQMLAQGASVEQIMRLVTTLNDQLTRRAIDLCIEVAEQVPPPFTWLAFGSEGRHEQTLCSDQDNGILFEVPSGSDAETIRQQLLPFASQVNQVLARCGFSLCQGNIMASNPELCLSVDEWRQRFARWIDQGNPEHLLNASIFFDFRPIYGNNAATDQLHQWLVQTTAKNPRFLRQLVVNALNIRPPLGLVGDFKLEKGEHAHTLNLKLYGLTPLVDAARIIALGQGSCETNTPRRLMAAANAGSLDSAEAEAWADAFRIIQLFRIRHHQQQLIAGVTPDNYVNPDTLNELDKRILKEAFRQARQLQAYLALNYNV